MSLLFSAAVIGTVGGGTYYLMRGRKAAPGREWVGDSVKAWRSKELDPKNFRVHVKETDLDRMFDTFDHDGFDPYYSPEGIEKKLSTVVGTSASTKILDSAESVVLRILGALKAVKSRLSRR